MQFIIYILCEMSWLGDTGALFKYLNWLFFFDKKYYVVMKKLYEIKKNIYLFYDWNFLMEI